ncbi:MAG: response regulator [Rhodospirillaceae bacterium]
MTTFQQQRVLVVDDEPFSQGLVAQMLRKAGAGEVLLASNGYEALDMLERHAVTAMIIDFRMPGIHGLELLKRIRTGKTAAERNLICVMLTGHAVRHLVGLAIVLDVDTFLAKPVSLETLIKHMNRALQYRFEALPVEDYEAVDVRHADAFLRTGGVQPPPPPPEKAPEDAAAEEFLEEMKAKAAEARLRAPPPAQSEPPGSEAPAPASAPAPAPVPAKPAAKAPARPAGKPASPPGAKPAAPREPAPAAAAPKGPVKAVKLSEIPEGAVIAKNIVGRTGTLLVAAGTPFRARYARRLSEISDIEGEIKEVWIHE